jgi:hypothetical protein
MNRSKRSHKKRQVLLNIEKHRFRRKLREKIDRSNRRKATQKQIVRLAKKYKTLKVEVKEDKSKKGRTKGYKDLLVPEKLNLKKTITKQLNLSETLSCMH